MKKVLFGEDAYPIFIMHEQLLSHGFLDDESLDEMWTHCCLEYQMFLKSNYNSDKMSEYDCIQLYVKSLINY